MGKYFIIAAFFLSLMMTGRAYGQVYDVACPAGTTVLNQALNPQNGHYKAYLCIDTQGNVTTPGTTPTGSNGSNLVNIKNFGAIGDAASSNACTTNTGSGLITSADNPWLPTDVGKFMEVISPTQPTTPIFSAPGTKIIAFNSVGSVTVNGTPGASPGSGQKCVWFTQDDTSAFTSAKAFAAAKRTSLFTNGQTPTLSEGGGIFCPPGGYAVSGTIFYDSYATPSFGMSFLGSNIGTCVIYPLSNYVGTVDSNCIASLHVGLVYVCQTNYGSDIENIYVEGLNYQFNATTQLQNGRGMFEFNHCAFCTVKHNRIFNIALTAVGPSANILFTSYAGIAEDNTTQGGGIAGSNNDACDIISSQQVTFIGNTCSNTQRASLTISGSGTRSSVGGQVSLINNLIDECGGTGSTPCTNITTSIVNVQGGVFYGGVPGLISVDGTSRLYLRDSNIQQFGSSAANIIDILEVAGSYVYSSGTTISSNGTAVMVSAPSTATFVDGGGNTFQNCLSGTCNPITVGNFTTQAFSGGIVPQSTSTHTQNVCPAVQGNLLATAQNLCTIILDRNYQLLTIGAQSGGTTPTNSTCATPPVITLSDGTRSATMTMTSGKTAWSSGVDAVTSLNQVFASGATLTVSIGANTCATPPANVTVGYILQSVLNF